MILHVVHRLDIGGLENGVVNLVNRMAADRYDHAIVCLSGYGAEFRRRILRREVEVVSLDKQPGKDLAMYGRMWRVLRRLRPAIVHTRNLGTIDMQWVAAAAGVRRRVHGEHGWEASDPRGRNRKSLRIRRACRPVIQRYVPMSRDISRWLEREVGVAPDRIRQLYNGVDTERFHPDGPVPHDLPWPHSSTRHHLAPDHYPLVIGAVGRLDPVKCHAAILRAVRAIGDRGLADQLRVIIAGDGPLRMELASLARELGLEGRVWFAGSRSDTPDVMRALDLFVLPSLNEGISNTILEAMATGLPVVATRVGGNPELVVEGVTGVLYDPDDPEALGQALLHYLADPGRRRADGVAGRDRAVRYFGLDAMVTGYLALYDEMLNL